MTTETPKRKRSRNKKTAVAEAPDEAVEAQMAMAKLKLLKKLLHYLN